MATYEGNGVIVNDQNRPARWPTRVRNPWIVTLTGGSPVELSVNPNSVTLSRNKTIAYQSVAGSDGNRVVMMDKGDEQLVMRASGSLSTQEQYETLETLTLSALKCTLQDDLERIFTGYFLSFTPERVRKSTTPWFHNYTIEIAILDTL